VAIIACSDSTGPSSRLTVSQLEGVWDLSRIEMVLASDSAVYQNVMPRLGLTATLAIRHDGTACLTVQSTGQSPFRANDDVAGLERGGMGPERERFTGQRIRTGRVATGVNGCKNRRGRKVDTA